MSTFAQLVVDGLEAGSVYAALALALVLIYRSTGLVNFAQGEMAMFSTYVYLTLARGGLSVPAAFAIAAVFSFAAGLATERLLIRRFASNHMALIVVTLALFVGVNALAGLLWSYQVIKVPGVFPAQVFRAGGVTFSIEALGTLATLAAVAGAIFALFRFTRLGLAMRGAASNVESAALLGLRAGTLLGIGWGLAALLGVVAGVLVTPRLFLDPNVMQGVLVFAIAAATVGGLDSPLGAVIAGLLLGVLENLAGTYLVSSGLRITVPLVLIIVFLTLRPGGMFGSARLSRV